MRVRIDTGVEVKVALIWLRRTVEIGRRPGATGALPAAQSSSGKRGQVRRKPSGADGSRYAA
jgi:hypothetical protein